MSRSEYMKTGYYWGRCKRTGVIQIILIRRYNYTYEASIIGEEYISDIDDFEIIEYVPPITL